MTRHSCKRQALMWSASAIAASLASAPVHADTPLSLAVSESLTYDSNIMRDNANKYRDARSTTSVTVGFNKEYGRQTYRASATGDVNKYKNTKDLDNNGYNVLLGFSSSLASNWNVSLDHFNKKQLQSFDQQSGRRYAESIVSRVTQGVVQYGLYGRWSTSLTLGHSSNDYQTINYYDSKSDYYRGGLRFSPTDLLYFDFGVRKTDGDNPNYPLLGGNVIGDPIKRTDYELNTQWIVTGYSRLTSRVGWTQERHSKDSLRDYNGLTGNLRWSYSPKGKTTYSIAIDRDTNNAGGNMFEQRLDLSSVGMGSQLLYSVGTTESRLTTSLYFDVNHSLTSKISLNAGVAYRQFKEERQSSVDGADGSATSTSDNRVGYYRSFSLGASYQIHRSVGLGCRLEKYDRTASLFNREYDGEQVNCNVTLTID